MIVVGGRFEKKQQEATVAINDPVNATWRGASLFSRSNASISFWISAEEYDESGKLKVQIVS